MQLPWSCEPSDSLVTLMRSTRSGMLIIIVIGGDSVWPPSASEPERSSSCIFSLVFSGCSCSTSRPIGLPLTLLSTLCAIWFIARMRLSALSKTTPGSNFCSLYWSVSMVYADKASGCARQQESLLSLAGYFPPVRALILRSVKEELACTRAKSLMAASVAASDSTRSTPQRKGGPPMSVAFTASTREVLEQIGRGLGRCACDAIV